MFAYSFPTTRTDSANRMSPPFLFYLKCSPIFEPCHLANATTLVLYNIQERDNSNKYFRTISNFVKITMLAKVRKLKLPRQETRYLTSETTSDASADFVSQYFPSFRGGKPRSGGRDGMGWKEWRTRRRGGKVSVMR